MTPNAQHKRAERERRKAAGYKRVECWIKADDVSWMTRTYRVPVSDAVEYVVAATRSHLTP